MVDVILEDESLRDGLQLEELVIPYEKKLSIFRQLSAAGVQRIQVGSFVNPKLVSKVKDALPEAVLSLHLHDTRGLGMANMIAGYEAVVRIFDTSAGGLGAALL
jgi:hydroxymethylglutaryl-CoA lyase